MYYTRIIVFLSLVGAFCFTITLAESWGILGRIFVLVLQIVTSPFENPSDRALATIVILAYPSYKAIMLLDWIFKRKPESEGTLTPSTSRGVSKD